MKNLFSAFMAAAVSIAVPTAAFAVDGAASPAAGYLAIAASIAIGLAALAGTTAQGRAVAAALESIGRNPGAAGKLLVPMVLGLAFIESLVVLSFVIAYGLRPVGG